MTRHCFILCVSAFAAATFTLSATAATPQQVQQAIEKAQKWLLDHRNAAGNWEVVDKPEMNKANDNRITDVRARQWGGMSALATYALLASGEDYRDAQMKKGIDFLLGANIQSTYGLGLSSQIVAFIPEKQSRDLVKRNVAMIYSGMIPPPNLDPRTASSWLPAAGFYSYWTGAPNGTNEAEFGKQFNARNLGGPQPQDWYDRSNGQYAVLGMWALADAGGEIRQSYWQIEDAAWKKAQLPDGGWNYNSIVPEMRDASPSMTAAGIATLYITQDFTLEDNWSVCKGGVKNTAIERGLHWMDQHINQALVGNFYTMYGIERIGTASGRKYFGTKDWFRIGADFLVANQNADGSWSGSHGPLPDTSFGLLFLARGRAPVLMNKLEYESASGGEKTAASEQWDERPRDVANLAKWVGKEDESYFNWQVVNLLVSPEELHDAPILYIAGSQALSFTKEQEDKLRTFVEQGGMILGNADCGRPIFANNFIALGKKLFPKYEFHATPPNDFIYNEQFKQFRVKPKVMELSNNVRKLMVLIPDADPARSWQTRSASIKPDMYGLGANIFLYAVDKRNLYAKGDTYIVTPDPSVTPASTLNVARLDLGDNPDPEPGGWPRMAAIMHNTFKTDLKVDLVKPEALSGYKVADLTGTGKIILSAASRNAIKQFVDGGGTLIVDAAGGDIEFADSVEIELNTIFSGSKLQPLAENGPPFDMANFKIDKIGWRMYAQDRVGDKRHAKLRGMTIGNRIAVFFSREDLSAGIVGEPVDGIFGYDPATATRLMTAILLYAINPAGPAAPVAQAQDAPPAAPPPGR